MSDETHGIPCPTCQRRGGHVRGCAYVRVHGGSVVVNQQGIPIIPSLVETGELIPKRTPDPLTLVTIEEIVRRVVRDEVIRFRSRLHDDLEAEVRDLRMALDANERDPLHANCRNVEEQLTASRDAEARGYATLKAENERLRAARTNPDGLDLMDGWLSRDEGKPLLVDAPDWWAKGWQWRDDALSNVTLRKERDEARAFKTYVHGRLDADGVPRDPEPQQNDAHGCRIEGRLNWVFRNRDEAVEARNRESGWTAEQGERAQAAEAQLEALRASEGRLADALKFASAYAHDAVRERAESALAQRVGQTPAPGFGEGPIADMVRKELASTMRNAGDDYEPTGTQVHMAPPTPIERMEAVISSTPESLRTADQWHELGRQIGIDAAKAGIYAAQKLRCEREHLTLSPPCPQHRHEPVAPPEPESSATSPEQCWPGANDARSQRGQE